MIQPGDDIHIFISLVNIVFNNRQPLEFTFLYAWPKQEFNLALRQYNSQKHVWFLQSFSNLEHFTKNLMKPCQGVYKTKTKDQRPQIENKDEDAYNKNLMQSTFSTPSANRPFSGKLFDEQA